MLDPATKGSDFPLVLYHKVSRVWVSDPLYLFQESAVASSSTFVRRMAAACHSLSADYFYLDMCTAPADADIQDQANEKDYSHEGFGFSFKKIQADMVMKLMSDKEVQYFKVSVNCYTFSFATFEPLSCLVWENNRSDHQGDERAAKEPVKKYGSGTADAPLATNL